MPARLWLVRHAESAGNVADASASVAGAHELELAWRDPDTPLSSTGHEQAAALGRWLSREAERPDLVLSSPYTRAYDTALAFGLPVERDERLRERDLGHLDGLTRAGIRARFPEEAARRDRLGKVYYRPPGGESWCDVAARVRAVLHDLEHRCEDGFVLCVTHQAVLLCFRWVVEGLGEAELLEVDRTSRVGNASVSGWRRVDGVLRPERFDDRSALAQPGVPETAEPEADAHVG